MGMNITSSLWFKEKNIQRNKQTYESLLVYQGIPIFIPNLWLLRKYEG